MRDDIDISSNTGSTINYRSFVLQWQNARPLDIDPAALALAEKQFSELPVDAVPDRGPAPSGGLHGLAPANPEFVGREADLAALATSIKANRPAAIGSVATAAAGLGGIGKSQLANEFAYRYGRYFAGGVFWISFADAAAIPSRMAEHGGAGGLDLRPDYPGLPLADQVALVAAAWRSELPRLLIFDNCEAEDWFIDWRPSTGGCRVLVTSRNPKWSAASGMSVHSLDALPRDESIALLCRHRPDLSAADPSLDAIADTLGDLPLALHLAGGYLREYAGADFATPAAYLADLTGAAILEHPSMTGEVEGRNPTDHDRHVGRTFVTAFKRLQPDESVDQLTLHILGRAAALAPGEAIPVDLLLVDAAETDAERDREQQRLAHDGLNRALRLGLLRAAGPHLFEIHRLVGHFVRSNVPTVEDDRAAVIAAVQSRVKEIDEAGLPAPMAPYISHLRHLAELAATDGLEAAGALLNELGFHHGMIANYVGAKAVLERALAIDEAVFGPNHPNVAIRVNDLGGVLKHLADLAGAKAAFERALAIDEAVLGPDHPNVAIRVSNLGLVLRDLGDHAGAKTALERSLAIGEAVEGTNHPKVAIYVNNLGTVLQDLGDLAGAKAAFERALAIDEAVFGPDHPNVATEVSNLGGVLWKLGNLAGARRPLSARWQFLKRRSDPITHPQ